MGGWPDPLVFVGGTPRSGTTLLRNMLDAHSDLAVPDESFFVHSVRRRISQWGYADDVDLAWHVIRTNRFFRHWGVDAATIERVLDRDRPADYADLLRAMFAAYAEHQGKPHAGDKTTDNALYFDWLGDAFPQSRFVHIVRDPREIAMSLALQSWNFRGVAGAAHRWVEHVGAARRAAVSLGPRYLEVRYERLVAEPERELRRICDLAGLAFEPGMLDYRDGALPDPHHARSREALQTDTRRWQDEMSRDDVATVEAIVGPLLDVSGYEPVTTRPTLAARAAVARYRWSEGRDWWIGNVAPALGPALRRLARR
jgi:hypothetical protein